MSDRILVSTRKGLFILGRRAKDWRVAATAFAGIPVSTALCDRRDGTLYAALAHGHFGVKLHRSENDGKTWTEIATPAFPPQHGGAADKAPPAVSLLWRLEPAGKDAPGVIWAGTIPGGLFRTEDRGDSWRLNEPLWQRPERAEWFGGGADAPGIHSIAIDPRDSRRLTVAVSCGGLWRSEDGGQSWALGAKGLWAEYMPPERREDPRIQDVHRLVQCRDAPEVFWLQHHNAAFRSRDGAGSWRELGKIRPSRYGFAVAAHPSDPDTAWFVPMRSVEARYPVDGKLVVARTRDGGRSFELLRRGLPQRDVYDLVYRHGLDVDTTGRRLVMGSTTGGVWHSGDGGTSWHDMPARLPPIYAARFA